MERITWQTHEYLHTEKTADWYWIVGAITVSVAVIAIIFNDLIFAILIIISSFTLALFASKKPELIHIEISNLGVRIDKNLYQYKTLDSFWLEMEDGHHRIILKSKKVLMPYISIPIENEPADQIHTLLSEYLPEEKHAEPFLEKLLIYLGF